MKTKTKEESIGWKVLYLPGFNENITSREKNMGKICGVSHKKGNKNTFTNFKTNKINMRTKVMEKIKVSIEWMKAFWEMWTITIGYGISKINANLVFFLLFLVAIWFFGYNHIKMVQEVSQAKKILFEEQKTIELITQAKKYREDIEKAKMEIEKYRGIIWKKEALVVCNDKQIERIKEGREVDLNFCENTFGDFPEVKKKEEKKEMRIERTWESAYKNIEPQKRFLFACKEVWSNNESKCAATMQLVYLFESSHGSSGLCKNQNNCYGIKEPNDKKGLKGDWSVKNGHIAFVTQEAWDIAFAYYFEKYHSWKTIDTFVMNWVWYYHWPYMEWLEDNYWQLEGKYKSDF